MEKEKEIFTQMNIKKKPYRDRKQFIRKKGYRKRYSTGMKFLLSGKHPSPFGFSGSDKQQDEKSILHNLLRAMGFGVKA